MAARLGLLSGSGPVAQADSSKHLAVLGRMASGCSRRRCGGRTPTPTPRCSPPRCSPVRVAGSIDLATARQLADQAVQAARQLGNERLLSRALAALCAAHFFAVELEAARRSGQEAVERARRLGDDVLLPGALLAYLLTIDPARSGPLHAEAIACTERSGDHFAKSALHHNAGATAEATGDTRRPGLTWKPPRKPRSRSATRTPPARCCWAACCAPKEIPTAPGPRSRLPCGSAAGTAATGI